MKNKTILLAILSLVLSVFAFDAESSAAGSSAAQVVEAFYGFHLHHDMGFSEAGLKAREKWIDAGLYDLLSKELKKPRSPDEAPDINGDPFTCSQEYPNAVKVTKATESGDRAKVDVVFQWPKGGNPPRPATLTLLKDAKSGDWKIADIVLADGYDLAKDLKQNLKQR